MLLRILAVLGAMALLVPAARAEELTEAQRRAVADAVRETLKDPDSANFKWLAVPATEIETDVGGVFYCGLVNAKNSYGGYVGFQPYAAMLIRTKSGEWVATRMDSDLPGPEETRVAAVYATCRQEGYQF